ncbi:MAG: polyprenyl synthetase family protein [Deltaproteobacteria bacterium]|nr:polyprenyl synthetase family protein [bacterium]MCB9476944.1 polyprenyl synthetase family protein [Deltaproteobacteria bacterium]MCB9478676.1 polyprenyl synthetase family protein [Deltaproteobacteria bacterium]MCB9489794.1 polyprenyl synthetase family protein [Deltaproteobacteria bacterium]
MTAASDATTDLTDLDFTAYADSRRAMVDDYLAAYMARRADGEGFDKLKEAMSYSLLGGGKRFRPVLAIAGCEAVGGDCEKVLPVAAAIEMLHTVSLIHDDLPAMDNDDLRRHRATNHKVFGEALAILAGDALITEAYLLLSAPDTAPPATAMAVIHEIAHATGLSGMAGGQSLDMLTAPDEIDEALTRQTHHAKTARFIAASAAAGALMGGADPETVAALRTFGENVGQAFQIVDDILNVTGDAARIGKSVGSDANAGKATYPAVHGLPESRRLAAEHIDAALAAVQHLGEAAEPLRAAARFVIERDR